MPMAIAPLNSPAAAAVVLSPMPIAKLLGELVQTEPPELPALMPLIDAHEAIAAPAPLSAAAASPDATAPSRRPPASLSLGVACCVFMLVTPSWDIDGQSTGYSSDLHRSGRFSKIP